MGAGKYGTPFQDAILVRKELEYFQAQSLFQVRKLGAIVTLI